MAKQKLCIGAAMVNAPAIPCMPTAYAPSRSDAKPQDLFFSRNVRIQDCFDRTLGHKGAEPSEILPADFISSTTSCCIVSKNFRSVLLRLDSHAFAGANFSGRDMMNGNLFPRAPVGDTPMRSSRALCLSSSDGVGVPQANLQVILATKDSIAWL